MILKTTTFLWHFWVWKKSNPLRILSILNSTLYKNYLFPIFQIYNLTIWPKCTQIYISIAWMIFSGANIRETSKLVGIKYSGSYNVNDLHENTLPPTICTRRPPTTRAGTESARERVPMEVSFSNHHSVSACRLKIAKRGIAIWRFVMILTTASK